MFGFLKKKKEKKEVRKDMLTKIQENVRDRVNRQASKKETINNALKNKPSSRKPVSRVDIKNTLDRYNKERTRKSKKVLVVEKENISLNKLKEALKTDFPTELINDNNRATYIYFMKLVIDSPKVTELSAIQYRNLMLLSEIYGLKKGEVIF